MRIASKVTLSPPALTQREVQPDEAREVLRRPVQFLNVARLLLALLAVVIVFSTTLVEITPTYKLFLAQAAALIYLLCALAFLGIWYRETTDIRQLAANSLATDLIIIAVLMHCFGGLESGLGILLIFVVGISALVLPFRTALFFASLVTLLLIGEALLAQQGLREISARTMQAGLYGLSVFFTAVGCAWLGRLGWEYRVLAERRSVDLANLEQINELIIRRMRTGVLVIDDQHRIRKFNESAWSLLGQPDAVGRRLDVIAPTLTGRLQQWRETGQHEDEGILIQAQGKAVVPRFLPLPGTRFNGTLIFLEDTAVSTRRARELVEGSLARLSASIAHEIRNPLAAMSHAAQLLAESDNLDTQDQRLLEIIQNHGKRMNDIVENVLRLSRRERAQPEHLLIGPWVQQLAGLFTQQHELPAGQVTVIRPDELGDTPVLVDEGHLHQVVWNLMENALRHAATDDQPARITLRVALLDEQPEIALDIMDDGPGIPADKRAQIFEPFFTTHHHGSGLGLYLAKQLCEANQAPLEYLQVPDYGACFRILLPRT